MGPSASLVLVWDRDERPPEFSGEVLLWRTFDEGPGASSVPRYLETHADRLRAKYLAFIYDLGESRLAGKSVVEHLAVDGGFSYWWMTRLTEKSPFKSPAIYNCLRLLALEEMLSGRKAAARLELAARDDRLAEALRALCGRRGLAFVRRRDSRRTRTAAAGALPFPVRGLLSFIKRLWTVRPLRRLERPLWFSGDRAVFICSFFANLDAASCARGVFRSRLWESLPERLHAGGRRVNWLQHFMTGPDVPDARTGLAWLRRCNADAETQGRHAFLESYLTWTVALKALKDWLRLNAVRWRLRRIPDAFTPKDSAVWLWPILREDWLTSLAGPFAAANCLWSALFDAALSDLPAQKLGLFICENQTWEAALLGAWRKYGHGEIVGVAHSTVPYWHLYYLDDPRVLEQKGPLARPLPDRMAVNGPAALRVLAGVRFPPERIVEVEAMRYLGLPRLAAERASTLAGKRSRRRILILGDVLPASMRAVFSMLERARRQLPTDCELTFKPHPLQDFDLSAYPALAIKRTTEPLDRILGGFDAAIAGNSTSAAVDAHLAGLPVIIGLNGDELNLSPLRGERGARFVGSSEELAQALGEALSAQPAESGSGEFFFLDPEIPRWRRLLRAL